MLAFFPMLNVFHWNRLRSNNSHHQIIIFIQRLIGKVKEEGGSGFLVDVGHPGPMLTGEAIVESLEESANWVLIGFSPKEYDVQPHVDKPPWAS